MGVFASGGGLMFPRGLAFGLDGNLYVVGANSEAILRYNAATGAFINIFASGGAPSFPTGIVFTSTTRTISHIANGAGWRTTVILIDTGAHPENFELKFWDEQGHPLPLDLGADGVTADLTGTIQPGVARFIRTAGAGPPANRLGGINRAPGHRWQFDFRIAVARPRRFRGCRAPQPQRRHRIVSAL